MIWPILEARAEIQKYFHLFFGSNENFAFEIYWPLGTVEKNSGKRSSKHNFARGILDEVAHVCRVAKASRQQQQLLCNHGPPWVELIFQVSFWFSNSENLIPYCNLIKGNLG